jgi:hypothetical protein
MDIIIIIIIIIIILNPKFLQNGRNQQHLRETCVSLKGRRRTRVGSKSVVGCVIESLAEFCEDLCIEIYM